MNGVWKRSCVEPVRQRQTKGAATDMFGLQPPRHTSTLPISDPLGPRLPLTVKQPPSGIPHACHTKTNSERYRRAACAFAVGRSGIQRIEQRSSLFEVGRVEALGEPAIDRREQVARFGMPALVAVE